MKAVAYSIILPFFPDEAYGVYSVPRKENCQCDILAEFIQYKIIN